MRILLALSLSLASWCVHGAFEPQKPEQPIAPGAAVTETVWSLAVAPLSRYDRIQVHRYRKGDRSRAVLLHMPGTNQSGELAPIDEDHNFWVYLANRGIEVYAMDYRTHAVPAEGVEDFSFMQEWTSDRFVDDGRLAAEFALATSGHERLFLSGFSRGVSFAYGLVSVLPEARVAGLVAMDGGFKRYEEKPFTEYESSVKKLVERKRFATDLGGNRGWENRHQLMLQTYQDSAGPALSDRYESIGEQLAATLYNAWGPGRLANPRDGISRVEPLARLLDTYDRWYPSVQNLDGRAVASQKDDPRTAIDDRWGQFTIPIIYFGTTGMGPDALISGIYSASKSGARDVEIHVLERYGHLDVLVGERAREEVFEPLADWLARNLERSPLAPAP